MKAAGFLVPLIAVLGLWLGAAWSAEDDESLRHRAVSPLLVREERDEAPPPGEAVQRSFAAEAPQANAD